jgi:maleylacetoacetate isomerase
MTTYNLHSYWRSSCSWRVRWALELKNLDYKTLPVNLLKNEQSSKEYLEVNPNGRIPTLSFDSTNLSGSVAILEYLEEKHPEIPLLPTNINSKAKVRELVNIIACDTQPIQNLAVMKYFSDEQEERVAYAKHWISRGLEAYENAIRDIAGSFSTGGIITLADICLIPQVYNANRFGVDLDQFPNIKRIWNHCMSLESCINASPEKQIDAV